jgi:nucleoside-diphosphate kinase
MEMERSLVIVKPDAMQRGLMSEVLGRLERRGLRFVGMKLMQVDRQLAEQHYAEHQGKPFYEGLVSYITSTPVVVAAIEGPARETDRDTGEPKAGSGACAIIRSTVGATNPAIAAPGTIRGDFGLTIGRNLVHASDSPASGRREVAIFFDEGELLTYERDLDGWILEQ